jgi:2-polyprenyl-3-methyl-5-hydroxy-6-metoxy-1,4-benzoquinol methylase
MVDVLSTLRGDPASSHFNESDNSLQRRSSAPTAVKFLLPVWGYEYVRQFLEVGLPTLLAPGNVPGVAKALDSEFVILTSIDDEEFIREHPAFRRLQESCSVDIRLIDHLITEGNYSTTITLAYTECVRSTGAAMTDTCFFFLVSDYIMADGSLVSALKLMQKGTSAILTGNFQVSQEDAEPWLRDKLSSAGFSLSLPPRQLMQWALNHLHPTTLANMVNIPFSHNSHTNRLFWRVDATTILGRFYLMHMLCIRPEISDFIIGASCDYSFVPEMCPSGNVAVLSDSDDYLVIEMQSRNHEAKFLRPGPLRAARLAKSLNEWTTAFHRKNAEYSLAFHAHDLPADVNSNVAEADRFIDEVARIMRRKPLPHRGHPYWRGAMAAFNDATGRQLTLDEWRMVLGLPADAGWFSDWLVWRARYALMGRPPHVFPWHPLWCDFRMVLQELEPFMTDQSQRLLLVSNSPNVFTMSLSASGERVHRVRCAALLEGRADRYDPLAGSFDICLVALSEGEMSSGDELIDRIVPLMRANSRLIIWVVNRRPMADADGFGSGVSYHGSRFVRPGAVPTEIRFIPASRLRWAAHRGMVRLRDIAAKWPILGIPFMGLSGPLMLVMSLIGNFDSLRRIGQTVPTGITSSLLMRLRVDARVAISTNVFSRFHIKRKKIKEAWLEEVARKSSVANNVASGAEMTREAQYERSLDLKREAGLASLGLLTNQVWHNDPRQLASLLARYKFVAKMLSGRRDVAEVGCGDAFGTRLVLQEVDSVTAYDADRVFVDDVRARADERWPLQVHVHDIVKEPLPQKYDAVFSLSVIEHLMHTDQHAFLANLRGSLLNAGIAIIGAASIESRIKAEDDDGRGFVNCKNGAELKALLGRYFEKVFLFSMNDDVVQTGYSPMAEYLFVMCTSAR